tara:strand:- start:7196 stop:7834 length:639 start_codon:yes stop_codon:yes gene_type:complete
MKYINFFTILATSNCLSSWSNLKFTSSTIPSTDLKVIDAMQCNIISKLWYKKIMGEEFGDEYKNIFAVDDDYDPMDVEDWMQEVKETSNSLDKAYKLNKNINDNHNLDAINKIESTLQKNQQDLIYLCWNPKEKKSMHNNFVLALIILHKVDKELILKNICCNPNYIWEDNISLSCLKKALMGLESKDCTINISEFLEEKSNQRIKLEWMFQ